MAVKKTRAAQLLRSIFLSATRLLSSRGFGLLVEKLGNSLVADSHKSLFLRRVMDAAQPQNPLRFRREVLPEVDLLIVAAQKDFIFLPAVIDSAVSNCDNPIRSITAIVPDSETRSFPELKYPVQLIPESGVLPSGLQDAVDRHHPPGRYGWVLQQALTLWFVRETQAEGVLVVDADTMLTAKRTFLGPEGIQLLMFSEEFHEPYEQHASRIWGPRSRHHGLSYVTHHQLMQPGIVREMFDTEERLLDWILSADIALKSPISEYHSYGRWLVEHYPNLVRLGRWGNKAWVLAKGDEDKLSEKIRRWRIKNPEALSVSAHSYLRER